MIKLFALPTPYAFQRWVSRKRYVQHAREKNTAVPSALNFFSPVRLIIACAVTLAIIVVASASLVVYNLRNRAVLERAGVVEFGIDRRETDRADIHGRTGRAKKLP